MPVYHPAPSPGRGRPGKILTLFALLLPVLVGMVGLVIDTGLLLAAQRQAQNAADAAALAAAAEVLAGRPGNAASTAAAYVQQSNGLAGATVVTNVPPTQGPYAGNGSYVEVVVTNPTETWFIQVLGGGGTQTAAARAVAGFEAVAAEDLIAALDPGACPGLAVDACTLKVQGSVAVNSQGAGYDQTNAPVNLGFPPSAAATTNGAVVQASGIRVVGGVDTVANYQSLTGGAGPLRAGGLLRSDPLLNLPAPTTANGASGAFPGVNGQTYSGPQSISFSVSGGQTVSFAPGVYQAIEVTGSGPGTVTFNPGVYVLLGGNAAGNALNVNTGATVTGNGVLFYNTGSDYDVTSGLPDANDGNALGSDSTTFGAVRVIAGQLTLAPLSNTGGPFDGMLFYQRRWNTRPVTLQGNSGQDQVGGTLYARWAPLTLSGPGTFTSQFLAGSVKVTSPPGGVVTLTNGNLLGKANLVFLVE